MEGTWVSDDRGAAALALSLLITLQPQDVQPHQLRNRC